MLALRNIASTILCYFYFCSVVHFLFFLVLYIALGGTLKFGKIGTRNVISVSIGGSFHVTDPAQNYFFAQLNTVTVESVMKAFDINVPKLPKVVNSTGFPEGLFLSYAVDPRGKNFLKRLQHKSLTGCYKKHKVPYNQVYFMLNDIYCMIATRTHEPITPIDYSSVYFLIWCRLYLIRT